MVLVRDLRAAIERLNPELPPEAREQAVEKITRIDFEALALSRRTSASAQNR